MRTLRVSLVGTAVLGFLLASTGAAGSQEQDATSGESPSDAAVFPTGYFVSVETGRDLLEFRGEGAGHTDPLGDYGWAFAYTVDGDVFTWLGSEYYDLGVSGEASGESSDATYRWDYDGERLAFELIGEDAADQRKSYMSRAYEPIEDPQLVMVATFDLDVGDPIRAWEAYVPAAEVGPDAYTSKVEYLGHAAAVPIAKGQPITPDLVAPPE